MDRLGRIEHAIKGVILKLSGAGVISYGDSIELINILKPYVALKNAEVELPETYILLAELAEQVEKCEKALNIITKLSYSLPGGALKTLNTIRDIGEKTLKDIES